MVPKRRLTACLLIVALIFSGVPMYASGASDLSAQAAQAGQLDSPAEPVRSDCPFHTIDSDLSDNPQPEAQTEASACCGSDCRCSCAGMSLMVHSIIQSGATIPTTRNRSNQATTLPSLAGDGLLRPPQA